MMSNPVSTQERTTATRVPHAAPAVTRGAWSVWAWTALTCALLGTSGGVRAWQDHRFSSAKEKIEAAPFPLRELPRTFGDWHVQDGAEKNLDPEIARVAGCTDNLIRSYTNATTGVSLTVLVLFGPAEAVFGHRPEICYPAAGYRMVSEPSPTEVAIDSLPTAVFRSEAFARERESRLGREEVHYSFRHGERWSPDVAQFWKDFRHHPSMFKIQVQRAVSAGEQLEVDNPSEQFLKMFVPEVELRLAQARSPGRR